MSSTKIKDIEWIKKEFGLEGYTLLTTEYKNQNDPLEYICPNGHKRHTTWKNWKKGNRCLICKNQKTKLSIDEIKSSFEKEGYILLSREYINNKTKLDYMCPIGHKNSITWADWNSGGYRCPDCANNKKLSLEEVLKDFEKEDYIFVSGDYQNNTSKLILECPNGHKFETSRVNWTSGHRCPVCYSERVNIELVRGSFESEGYKLLSTSYIDAHTKLDYLCPNGHLSSISWASWKQGSRCRYCRDLKHRVSLEELKEMFEKENYTFVEESYLKDKLEYVCPKGHEGSVSLGNWKTNGVRCPICGNNGTSTQEQSLIDYVKSLNININTRDRSLIKPKEIDIVIPEKKIAIEYCGLYWHSELMDKNNNYHLSKLERCEKESFTLITIFEDEWISKNDIVRSRLRNIFNISEGVRVLYARKLNIKEISTVEARKFCEENHLQGYANSKVKLGAFDKDELVSIMTFSTPSLFKGQRAVVAGVWELSRFCSKLNYNIVGIASRFLSYFKNNYEWYQIFSYADRRWSTGNLYIRIGFKFSHYTMPSYWYFVNGDIKRIHRFVLRKKPEEPKDVTEWELRKKQGYNRIWDCGNLKYIMCNK